MKPWHLLILVVAATPTALLTMTKVEGTPGPIVAQMICINILAHACPQGEYNFVLLRINILKLTYIDTNSRMNTHVHAHAIARTHVRLPCYCIDLILIFFLFVWVIWFGPCWSIAFRATSRCKDLFIVSVVLIPSVRLPGDYVTMSETEQHRLPSEQRETNEDT